jgi:hypothetical protein
VLNISQTGLKVGQTLQGASSTEGGWVIVFNVKEAHELETSNDDSECWEVDGKLGVKEKVPWWLTIRRAGASKCGCIPVY